MTSIKKTRNQFDVICESHAVVSFDLEDNDGTVELWVLQARLNPKQLRKLIEWLERSERVITGCEGIHD